MYAITRKATYRRSLIIFVLVTFLFLPFSKPKKAEAFALPLLPLIAEGILGVGATIMVWSGVTNFVSDIQMRHEAEKLVEGTDGAILFKIEIFNNQFEWYSYSQVADWSKWTGEYRIEEKNGYDKITEFINNSWTQAIEQGQHTVSINVPVQFKISVPGNYYFNVTVKNDGFVAPKDINIFGIADSYLSAWHTENFQVYSFSYTSSIYEELNKTKLNMVKQHEVSKQKNGNTLNFLTQPSKDITLPYVYNLPQNVELQLSQSLTYLPTQVEGVSKDKLQENIPVDSSINVSGMTTIPLNPTLTGDKTTEFPGVQENVKDESIPGSDVITGWGWLDDILNSILNGIKAIPGAITGWFHEKWQDIVDIKDYVVSIPSQISSWWEGLWTDVPAIDFTPLTSVEISKVFPFSIPFDLKNLLEILLAEPKAPVFDIPLWTEKVTLDLTKFNLIADIVRVFCILGWCFYLINRHKQMEE